MKKIISSLLLCLFLNSFIFSYTTNANNISEKSSLEPLINSKNVIVLDRKTLLPLYEKNAYSKVAMASTTKILTCIIALETTSLSDIVSISSKAAHATGSTLGLTTNSKITLNDLLYGLMLRSGNDCAIAIAEHISGSTENFSILMNQKASDLGLINSHFVTPHGLDHPEHYTTAFELAILTNYALKNPTFQKIVSSKNYTITLNGYPRNISNTNELLGNTYGVYGVKTGFTFEAGRCLVSVCKRDNLDIIIVVLGADTKHIRTQDSKNLINYIYNTHKYVNIKNTLENSFNNYLLNFKNNYYLHKTIDIPILVLDTLNNYDFPLSNNDISNLYTKIYTINSFSSNIKAGSIVGELHLYCQDKLICKVPILQKNQLQKNSWKYYFKLFFQYFKYNV